MFPELLFQIAQIGARLKGNALDAIHPSLDALKAFLYGVEPFLYRVEALIDRLETGPHFVTHPAHHLKQGFERRLCGEFFAHA